MVAKQTRAVDTRQAFIWATQMIASLSWFVCILIYASYEHGDIWQIVSFEYIKIYSDCSDSSVKFTDIRLVADSKMKTTNVNQRDS